MRIVRSIFDTYTHVFRNDNKNENLENYTLLSLIIFIENYINTYLHAIRG